ncbi:lipoprotein [Candidatus Kinetoplastibacterium desouzaii TCC079E]|uniref:Lipoprotein n=1 Tax=Candidatus Kinetoplastidibacterium desouzai TCC079E TaxID=1208919 RepID=M1M426_9PROT|nr:outer membrane protein assembly factor BamD [Candidatus Kinetoplastibacterium desouzaii]AGF46985.1 lipoprotein [Candidatus Kinetoplastibacterium desouzaii TCC079E]
MFNISRKKIIFYIIKYIFILSLTLTISSCTYNNHNSINILNESEELLYKELKKEISHKNWEKAKALGKIIKRNYPSGNIYQNTLIDMIYIYWQEGSIEDSLNNIRKFQERYPNHPKTDYILYLKGRINFTPTQSLFSKITKQKLFETDSQKMQIAYECYKELIKKFPTSIYAKEAKKLIQYTIDNIARNELYIAKYYYYKKAYLASINRANEIAHNNNYDNKYKKEAIEIITKSRKNLGINQVIQ